MLTFVISFLVIGQFWIAHHRLFRHVRHLDAGLLWAQPLHADRDLHALSLSGARRQSDLVEVSGGLLAASMTVASAALGGIWLYVVGDGSTMRRRCRGSSLRSLTTLLIFALSVAAAIWGLLPAVLLWLVVLPLARRLLARHRV